MAEIAEMTTQYTLKLPAEIATRFQPADRFTVWVEGDTLHLKLIDSSSVDLEEPSLASARTSLGHQLREARAKIIASGEPLLGWADLEQEVAERRGNFLEDEPE